MSVKHNMFFAQGIYSTDSMLTIEISNSLIFFFFSNLRTPEEQDSFLEDILTSYNFRL